ncbi:MAG: amidophosphoribosyltransferase [Candidatus Tectomicrobia bacterium]|uniref:Amidophosphoribosyltransferase n=1 Tax=Tectimicrobiota bacterium TaxID=2528274 RepID=A0A932FVR2_UNCTE|nr:amidophosphoribosyltransferase [Candidatus Tectomicrobia bacterium]
MEDKLHEECGIFGVFGCPEAANLTYLGLYALQHRGQESSGIVSSDGRELYAEISMGLVADIFTRERLMRLPGGIAIGHNRYSTTGSSQLKNAQPILVDFSQGSLALAHNGNLVNATRLRRELEARGSIFRSTIDSEVLVHLIAASQKGDLISRVIDAFQQVEGASSLLIMTKDQLIGIRDPHGFRPLSLGRLGNALILTSETCALDLIEAQFIRDLEPGEILFINQHGMESFHPFAPRKRSQCVFEFIYFSRPDSDVFGQSVHLVRKALGKRLAHELPVEADIVVPVPDSGVPAALGYAEESGIPFEMGLIRNHYVGRTFIEPQQSIRHFGVKIKLNANKQLLQGKRVLIVDDSIVRGTTSRKIVQMVRKAGAREVHVRIGSPPNTHPCFYGIDTPTRSELIAANCSVEEICQYLTADSLAYLSMEGLIEAIGASSEDFCFACFDGNYPTLEVIERLEAVGQRGRRK